MERPPVPVIATGIPNLDLILGGGVPAGDVLLVTGPAGAGKTTLCFQMLFHAAAAGQHVVYVATLAEPPTKLLRHLRSFRFYDESRIGKSLFLLNVYPLITQGLDAVTDALVRAVREHHAAILVLDGLMTIHDLNPTRAPVGLPELDALMHGGLHTGTITLLAVMAQNLVLYRLVEYHSELFRIVSILKMQDSTYDSSIRQYEITDTGLHVLGRIESAEGLLTGIARLPSESRRKPAVR